MSDQERMIRAGVITLAVDYSRSNSFDYDAHMAAAHIEFFLKERSGLSLVQQVWGIQQAHLAVIRMEELTFSDSYRQAHRLLHELIGAKIQQMRESGMIPPAIEMFTDQEYDLKKYDSDFQAWAKQLQEPEES